MKSTGSVDARAVADPVPNPERDVSATPRPRVSRQDVSARAAYGLVEHHRERGTGPAVGLMDTRRQPVRAEHATSRQRPERFVEQFHFGIFRRTPSISLFGPKTA
jgi:hypothetical protein